MTTNLQRENLQLKDAIEFCKDIIGKYQAYQDCIEEAILETKTKADLLELQEQITQDRQTR